MNTKLDYFFQAKNVAIIGASPRPETPGGTTVNQLQKRGFAGEIYLVNPKYDQIGERKCFSSITEIQGEVDLAIVAVAAKYVLTVVKECASKGVGGVIIYTAGFSETKDQALKDEQKEIEVIARLTGMRIMGPNCVGLVNNANNMWASFATPPLFEAGFTSTPLGIISQSGFFGIAIYQLASYNGMGFRYFASVGNQADLSFTDFFDYMVKDKDIKVVCAYLEGLKEEEDILPVARRALAEKKPVVVIKVGSTEAGSRAAKSHTGALAGREENYAALFKQTGIARAEDFEQLMSFLLVALVETPPKGRNVGIISVSGGGAVMLADKCGRAGLHVPDLHPETIEKLDDLLPSFATSGNPQDLTGKVLEEPLLFGSALEVLLDDPGLDTVLVSFHIDVFLCWAALAKLRECIGKTDKNIIIVGTPLGEVDDVEGLINEARRLGVAVIRDMNYAVWSLASYVEWLEKCHSYQNLSLPSKVRPLNSGSEESLTEYVSGELLRSSGFQLPKSTLVKTAREAAEAVHELACPAAFKIQSPDILHKTEAGGVKLGIKTTDEAEQAFQEIMTAAADYQKDAVIEGVLVVEMLAPGQEIIVGMKRDEALGPVIMFGLGGVFVEVLEDVSLRIAPLTPLDAKEMVEDIKGCKLLQGYRGTLPCDIEAVEDLLLKVSRFAMDNPQVKELDLNPVLVYPQGQGLAIADALIIRVNSEKS